jgi:hypothetical protein
MSNERVFRTEGHSTGSARKDGQGEESPMEKSCRESGERSINAWKRDMTEYEKALVKEQHSAIDEELQRSCPKEPGESEEKYLSRAGAHIISKGGPVAVAAARMAQNGRDAWKTGKP